MGDGNVNIGGSTQGQWDWSTTTDAASGSQTVTGGTTTGTTTTDAMGRSQVDGQGQTGYVSRSNSPSLPPPDSGGQKVMQNPAKQLKLNPDDPISDYNTTVEQALDRVLDMLQGAEDPPLTDAEIAQLKFAFHHPDLADPATVTKLNTMDVREDVKKELDKAGPPPEGWEENSDDFDEQVSQLYTSAFDNEMSKMQLSGDDQAKLRMLLFHPDADVAGKDALMATLQKVQSNTLKDIAGVAGLPANLAPLAAWQPVTDADVGSFDNAVSANFQALNETKLAGYINSAQPPLTADQQSQLRQAISQYPDTKGIPDDIAAIASTIIDKSTASLQAKYGLPPTWTPPAGPTLWKGNTAVLGALTSINNTIDIIDDAIQNIPDGPNKASLVSTLNMIKSVLQELADVLYKSEGDKATSQKGLETAITQSTIERNNQRMDQLKQQWADQKAAADKAAKGGTIGKIMQIVGPIIIAVSIIATIASFGTLGPVAVGIILAVTALSITVTAGGPDLLTEGAHALGTLVTGALSLMGVHCSDSVNDLIGKILVVVILVAMVVATAGGAAGAVGSSLAPSVGSGLAGAVAVGTETFATSGAGQSIMEVSDPSMDASKQAMYGAIIGAGVGLIGAAGVAAASKAAMGEASAATRLAEKITEQTNELTSINRAALAAENAGQTAIGLRIQAQGVSISREINRSTLELLEKGAESSMVKNLSAFVSLSGAAVNAYGSYVNYQVDMIMADLARVKAAIEAADTMSEDQVQAIRQMIKNLQKIVEDLVNSIKGVNQSIEHNVTSQKVAFASPG